MPRYDGIPKTTGQSRYAADLWRPPDASRVGSCEYLTPTRKFFNIDTSRTKSIPGVRAVLTADDVPEARFGQFILDETLFGVRASRKATR